MLLLKSMLNKTPILNVGCDDYFGGISDSCNYRFSFICLPILWYKLYLLTYKDNFSLFKLISIDDIRPWPDMDSIEKAKADYSHRLSSLKPSQLKVALDIENDFLTSRKSSLETSQSNLADKISLYSTFLLALAGLLTFSIDKLIPINGKDIDTGLAIIYVFVFVGIVYGFNGASFVYKFQRNKNRYRSTFKELKQQSNKISLVASNYYDWYSLKSEVDCLSNYVYNTEKYVILSSLLLLLSAAYLKAH